MEKRGAISSGKSSIKIHLKKVSFQSKNTIFNLI